MNQLDIRSRSRLEKPDKKIRLRLLVLLGIRHRLHNPGLWSSETLKKSSKIRHIVEALPFLLSSIAQHN